MDSPSILRFDLGTDTLTAANPDDPNDVEWALRYGTPTRAQLLVAASFISSYKQLVGVDSQRSRDPKIAAIRRARDDAR